MTSKISHKDKFIFIHVLLLLEWEELYCEIKKIFETIEKEFESRYSWSKFELPDWLSKIYENEVLIMKIRDNAWKVATEQGYISAIELFIDVDSENLNVTDEEISKIYKIKPSLIQLVRINN